MGFLEGGFISSELHRLLLEKNLMHMNRVIHIRTASDGASLSRQLETIMHGILYCILRNTAGNIIEIFHPELPPVYPLNSPDWLKKGLSGSRTMDFLYSVFPAIKLQFHLLPKPTSGIRPASTQIEPGLTNELISNSIKLKKSIVRFENNKILFSLRNKRYVTN